MSDAPKEIWVNRYSSAITTYNPVFVSAEKYIHEDESTAREKAAHKRGLEEAAQVVDESDIPTRYIIAAAIRAKMEND